VIPRKLPFLFVVFLFVVFSLSASEAVDGHIRLIANERTGSFSLFFLSDPSSMRYEPLFNARDPSASFLSVSVDGRIYRLGEDRNFSTTYERQSGNPAVVYEVNEVHNINIAALEEAVEYGKDANMLILIKLQVILDQFIAGEINLNEQDLTEIERSMDRFRNINQPL